MNSDYVAPKVFISYSWTSDDYADWIKSLAEKLMSNGVDVILDRWDLKVGQDKFVFMEQMVNNPDISKVLLMCDKRYKERADKREGGVGTESTIISQEVYNAAEQEKFIAVVTEREKGGAFLPTFIKSRIYIDLSDPQLFERGYEDLLRTLTGRPSSQKPPLGRPPSYLFEPNKVTSPTTFALRAFESALTNDKRQATGLGLDYLERLSEAINSLQVDPKATLTEEQRDKVMLSKLNDWNPLRDELAYSLRLICRYNTVPRLFEEIPLFLEKILRLTFDGPQHRWNQHFRYIVHEAFLYTVTIYLKENLFDNVQQLLDFLYRYSENTKVAQKYGVFCRGETEHLGKLIPKIWEEETKGRTYKNPQHVWLQKRVNEEFFSIEILKEADMILWLRSRLEVDPKEFSLSVRKWNAIAVGSLDDAYYDGSYPLFQRAVSRKFFERFKVVLGVESKEDFTERWNRAFSKNTQRGWDNADNYWERIFCANELASM